MAKKYSIEAEKVTGDNIYKILICFDILFNMMGAAEKCKLMESLIQEIQICRDAIRHTDTMNTVQNEKK